MTVSDLIEELKKFSPDAEIYVEHDEGTCIDPLKNNPFRETEMYVSKNDKVKVVIIEV